jgi:hypothetical protein
VAQLLSSDEFLKVHRMDPQGSAESKGGQLAAAQNLIDYDRLNMENASNFLRVRQAGFHGGILHGRAGSGVQKDGRKKVCLDYMEHLFYCQGAGSSPRSTAY